MIPGWGRSHMVQPKKKVSSYLDIPGPLSEFEALVSNSSAQFLGELKKFLFQVGNLKKKKEYTTACTGVYGC